MPLSRLIRHHPTLQILQYVGVGLWVERSSKMGVCKTFFRLIKKLTLRPPPHFLTKQLLSCDSMFQVIVSKKILSYGKARLFTMHVKCVICNSGSLEDYIIFWGINKIMIYSEDFFLNDRLAFLLNFKT